MILIFTNSEEEVNLETMSDVQKEAEEVPECDTKIGTVGDGTSEPIPTKSSIKEQDPWSLDLFTELKPPKPDSNLSNASLLITNQGDVHVIPQKHLPSSSLNTETKKLEQKITRSISQPQVNTSPYVRYPSGLFKLYRKEQRQRPESLEETQYASDFYLYTIMWACVVMIFWKNMILLPILPIPIFIYVVKHIGLYLGVWNILGEYWVKIRQSVSHWCSERSDALVPLPVRGIYKVTKSVNVTIKKSTKESIDTVASCVVISALIIFVICASIFFVFQVGMCESLD